MLQRITKLLSKKKSKKGFTLVEALCAIMILAIVFAGILNAVAFSRQMVFTNNNRDKASDKAQLIADEIVTVVGEAKIDPVSSTADADITSIVANVTNNRSDAQYDLIGEVTKVSTFTEPKDFVAGTTPEIQFTASPVLDSCTPVASGSTTYEIKEAGWNITVRVYYPRVNDKNTYDCVEITGFAPFSSID